MKTPGTLLLRSACAVLFSSAVAIARSSGPPAPLGADAVELTAWLQVEDLSMSDVVVEVVVNGNAQSLGVTEAGRFSITLPADADVVLRFTKPGHQPKEVVVDTRNVHDGKAGQKRLRRVRFGVVLNLERHMAGLVCAAPVGSIGFEQGGGCLAVKHDRQVTPAHRQAPMEF